MRQLITMMIFLFTFSACKVSDELATVKTPVKTEIRESTYILHSKTEGNILIVYGLLGDKELKEVLENIHCDKVSSIFCKPLSSKDYKKQIKVLKETLEKHKQDMDYRRNNPTAYMFEDYGKENY